MSEEQWMPENKNELLAAIRREWKLLMDVVAKLEAANKLTAPDEGGWSAKDNLAHLAEWMNVMLGYHLDRRPPEEVMRVSEEVTRDWDMEVINPVLYERNKDRSTQDVLEELNQVYERVLQKLESTLFEDLLKPRYAEDPEKRPVLLWVLGDTTDHFAEHRETIEKML